MKKAKTDIEGAKLRQKSEELLLKRNLNKNAGSISESEKLKLIHELEVHQIELEFQNKELIEAKEAAQIATEKYVELYDFALFGFFTLSKEGEILALNLNGAKMLGKNRFELVNRRFALFISDESKAIFNSFCEKISISKVKQSCEVELLNNSSSNTYVQLSGIIKENDDQFFVMALDITSRKLAEIEIIKAKEKAEASEKKVKLLNRLTSEMLLLQDLKSTYKFIAENLQKHYPNTLVLCVSIDELSQQTRLEIISGLENSLLKKVIKISGFNPIDRTYKLTDNHNSYFKSGNFVEFDGGLAGFSASEFPAFAASAIEKLIDLHKIYTIGINKDDGLLAAIHFFTFNKQVITDGNFIEVFVKQAGLVLQKKMNKKALIEAKEKAEESKKRFKSLIENAPDAVAINDKEGRLTYVSPNAYRHFGYSENELIGHFGDEFTHPEDLDIVFKAFDTIVRNPDHKATVKYRFRKRNGEYRWIETTFTNLLDDETIAGFVLNFSDITEKKQVLDELVFAKEKAEESDRLKSAFLANMSHEIRTPMNGILGFTNLLKEPGLAGKNQQRFIDIIEKSGHRMLSTVNDIIDISKIESGLVDVIISDINLNKQLDELFEFFLPEAKKKNIQLSITRRAPDQQAKFKSDKEKLNSILTNFIKNAIKYTHAGSIEFGYSINKKAKQNKLEFFVKDTGIGIPKERQKAIFNRFEQADIEDQQVFEGSGLGLAISKAYVEMLGGRIWVESEEGVGSQFYFTIPYKTNNNEIPKKNTENSNKQQSVKKDLKILIVEDEEFAITHFSIVLKEYAKEMLFAKTGIEAVKMCRENLDIDIILMDIKMPGIDGYEATRQIREFNKNVFILAQTAYAQLGEREYSIQAGCDDYISKPIDKKRLLEILSNRF